MKTWFTDLRKIALISLIATVAGAAIPAWKSIRQMIDIQATNPDMTWVTPAAVLIAFITATLPLFYFALFRNDGTLHFARRFRRLALAGALSLGLYVAIAVLEVIGVFGTSSTGSVLFHSRSNASEAAVSVLAQLSYVPVILLTIALYRQSDGESNTCPAISQLLRISATACVVVLGIGLAINAFRLLVSPLAYFLRSYAPPAVGESGSFVTIVARTLPEFLSSFGIFVAPYIFYKSRSQGDPEIG
jgi:hypothetical protein